MMAQKSVTRRAFIGVALCALAPLLLGFLCFPLVVPAPSGATTPVPAATFAPTVSAIVAAPTPGTPSDLDLHLSVPAGSTLPIGATFDVPAGWTVASDSQVSDGSLVGSVAGFMTVADPFFFDCGTNVAFDPNDVPPTDIELLEATTATSPTVSGADTNANGTPDVADDVNPANGLPDGVDKYPAFLNTILSGPPHARYFGHTEAAGISDLYVNVVVNDLGPGGPYRVTTIVNDPTAPPESATSRFCAPQSFTLTLFGTSGAQTVYSNPASFGAYTFSASLVSEFDFDNDGVSNGLDNCPANANSSQGDADQDYVGDACETDSVEDFDVDADGFENGYDNCMFDANAGQADADFDDIGDACDPNSTVPNGANYYLSCTDPVGIGQADPGGATCVPAGITPGPTVTATPTTGPVGGIAQLPAESVHSLEMDSSAGDRTAHWAVLIVALASLSLVVVGAVSYTLLQRSRQVL